VAAGLAQLGVRRYQEIAAWRAPDVRRVREALGLRARINQENWIEQAEILAKGGETHFARRRARGEGARAHPTAHEGESKRDLPPTAVPQPPAAIALAPRAATGGAAGVAAGAAAAPTSGMAGPAQTFPSPPARPPEVAERAAFARPPQPPPAPAPAPGIAPAEPVRPASAAARDRLLRIGGIDADIEKLLMAQGIVRYSQIAHWSPADVMRIEQLIGAEGRIMRENWVEQAQILSRGGDTSFSREFDRATRAPTPGLLPSKLADAIREQAAKAAAAHAQHRDLSQLRSVRSEAYQHPEPGPEAAQRAALQDKVPRSAAGEDLKRIRGIGVLIEKKLNSMGVSSYEQIANWTAEDIDRVSQTLDFKGRIERENWVEQARILASGGATEFARRVDRGEVEGSRTRG
jgi:predicted flap endonuclease-1-like 5' DNA nuclease